MPLLFLANCKYPPAVQKLMHSLASELALMIATWRLVPPLNFPDETVKTTPCPRLPLSRSAHSHKRPPSKQASQRRAPPATPCPYFHDRQDEQAHLPRANSLKH